MGAVIVTGVLKTHPIQGDIIHDVEKNASFLNLFQRMCTNEVHNIDIKAVILYIYLLDLATRSNSSFFLIA